MNCKERETTIPQLIKEAKTRKSIKIKATVNKSVYSENRETSTGFLKDPKSESELAYIASGKNSNYFITANVTNEALVVKGSYYNRIKIVYVTKIKLPKIEEITIG